MTDLFEIENTSDKLEGTKMARIAKKDTPILRWLQDGVSKDDHRAALEKLHLVNGVSFSVDGFTLRAAESYLSELADGEKASIKIKEKITSGKIVQYVENPYEAPEKVKELLPDHSDKKSLFVRVAVNSQMLSKILAGMKSGDHCAVLTIRIDKSEIKGNQAVSRAPVEVQGQIDYKPAYAIIMPMHLEGAKMNTEWRPDFLIDQEEK